ncbi:hypothetical protein FHR81_004841 [Actinoalloteichus hoggarensis]|uniref:Uncharacterized protein n=1 Tax=Actinoalloteichus hoggarensis TaxID=1470176 RepID=A0A221W827_9PSEU|nr:hypothetical protein [Actinoalloteichus hoggarensis]ASO22150.1 hypothetical protein AHOG_22685 [Actinoalloteichus hoggarensis]MBB5923768.1 hypothetical protein [Actinoalloteichus hoggarensis]
MIALVAFDSTSWVIECADERLRACLRQHRPDARSVTSDGAGETVPHLGFGLFGDEPA